MSDTDDENISNWLALVEQFGDYPDWLRAEHKKRVIRLNDAKELLRSSTRSLENTLPDWWRVVIAGVMRYAGEAILTFAGRVKLWIKGESLLNRIIGWFTGEPLQIATKFGAFFGLKSEAPKSIGGVLVKMVKPTPSGSAVTISKFVFSLTELGILARRLTEATVGADHDDPTPVVFSPSLKSKIRNSITNGTAGRMVLPQRESAPRFRRKVRSRG